jgi:hypothetical protein
MRQWQCPNCGKIIKRGYDDLAYLGPVGCNDCNLDMVLLPDDIVRDEFRRLHRIADRLESDTRPGHVDYISKKEAANSIRLIAYYLQGELN